MRGFCRIFVERIGQQKIGLRLPDGHRKIRSVQVRKAVQGKPVAGVWCVWSYPVSVVEDSWNW